MFDGTPPPGYTGASATEADNDDTDGKMKLLISFYTQEQAVEYLDKYPDGNYIVMLEFGRYNVYDAEGK